LQPRPILSHPILSSLISCNPHLDTSLTLTLTLTGSNSIKTDGTVRTIKGFSSTKLTGEKWYDIYVAYYGGEKEYADKFTTSACKGTDNFATKTSPVIGEISRIEGCKKGAAYMNVWMYVIHEMEAAITDCNKGVTASTHWDEAVAFYTGSTTLVNPTTNIGYFQYSLAEKKCSLFKTCGASTDNSKLYKSTVNEKVMSLFASGSSLRSAGRCSNLVTVKEALVKQFTVPIIQGIMQYIYQSTTDKKEKSKAELYSFASALLPLVNSYSTSVATTLKDNTMITNVEAVPSGAAAVKASLESVYGAIGITCSDVGGFTNTATGAYYAGMEPCTDSSTLVTPVSASSSSSRSTNMSASAPIAIALIIIVLAFFLFLGGLLGYCYRKKIVRSMEKNSPCIPKIEESHNSLVQPINSRV
jgi:hypothetical protein